jgi:hypothetical protein
MADPRARNRFDTIRRCERDMRVMCREMGERRSLQARLRKIINRRLRGYEVDEIEFARLKSRKNRLDVEIPKKWDEIHNRMNRDRARRERIMAVGPERSSNGKRSNA